MLKQRESSATLCFMLQGGLFKSETISEHKSASNWADKVLKQQTDSSGNKQRHPVLKYDINIFQYRAFYYSWTTEGRHQILLCNLKPQDKWLPMFLVFKKHKIWLWFTSSPFYISELKDWDSIFDFQEKEFRMNQ